jgi:carboxymethylenebutenolidase
MQTGEKGGRIARDMEIAANWLVEEIAASGAESKVGLVGFASGGGAILEALARDGGRRFATAVCFYPTGFEPALATQIQVPLLLICGGNDDRCSPHLLESVAAQTGNTSKALSYPTSGHGFAHAPASVDEDAEAESAFVAMKSWLHDKLVVVIG